MQFQHRLFILASSIYSLVSTTSLVNQNFSDIGTLITGRIVGGKPVNINDHPYQVSLRNKGNHFCGGSIYTARLILTASHCLVNKEIEDLSIVVGSSFRDGRNGYTVPVRRAVMHELFERSTFNYDVAILILKRSLPLNNETVSIIKLDRSDPPPGQLATLTGWGKTTESGVSARKLQKVEVPVISVKKCLEHYDASEIFESMFCAGNRHVSGEDACQGDSGGPLVMKGKLAGIISWGHGCGRPEYPGVYAKVSFLYDWITKTAEKALREEGSSESIIDSSLEYDYDTEMNSDTNVVLLPDNL